MASTHIYPTTHTRLAGELNALVESMKRVKAEAAELKLIMDQVATGGDWTSLAAEFGYDSAGDAETAYNLIGSALADDINGSFFTQVVSRMG